MSDNDKLVNNDTGQEQQANYVYKGKLEMLDGKRISFEFQSPRLITDKWAVGLEAAKKNPKKIKESKIGDVDTFCRITQFVTSGSSKRAHNINNDFIE